MSAVTVQGLTADTTEIQLREFFSYCGDIVAVMLHPADPSCGRAAWATIQFAHSESVDIAVLLSGAAVNGAAIEVNDATVPGSATAPSENRRSAVGSVNGLQASGLLQGGKEIIGTIRDRAAAVDAKYGIRDAVVNQARAIKNTAVGAVNYVTGRSDKGDVQVACWYWRENQPQWGPDPRLDAARKAAYATGCAL